MHTVKEYLVMTPVVNVYMIRVDMRESVLYKVINSNRIKAIQTYLLNPVLLLDR